MNRIDHIVNRSAQRHAINNMQVEALLNASMEMIEEVHVFIKYMNQIAVIVQGDDKEWAEVVAELSDDSDFHEFRDILLVRTIICKVSNKSGYL